MEAGCMLGKEEDVITMQEAANNMWTDHTAQIVISIKTK